MKLEKLTMEPIENYNRFLDELTSIELIQLEENLNILLRECIKRQL